MLSLVGTIPKHGVVSRMMLEIDLVASACVITETIRLYSYLTLIPPRCPLYVLCQHPNEGSLVLNEWSPSQLYFNIFTLLFIQYSYYIFIASLLLLYWIRFTG